MIFSFARFFVAATCLLFCSFAIADFPQHVHVILGDGYTKMTVSEGTSPKAIQTLAAALTEQQYAGLTLSVSPTVSFAGIEHRSICIAIDSHEQRVLLSVPNDTSMQLAISLVEAIESADQGAVVLLSRKTFDAIMSEADDDSADTTSKANASSSTAVVAAPPIATNVRTGNSYNLYTKALHVKDNGVVAVPSRYKWSVETCVVGFDSEVKPITDSRVMLRLYDPDENFTSVLAQMDLETAEKLQRELGDIIAKKRQNPDFQYQPQLYDPSLIPGSNRTATLKAPTSAPENAK
jgi:hypothetical protein